MSQNVEPIRAVFSTLVNAGSGASGPDLSDQRRAQQRADQLSRHRLIIEGDPDSGYIYKSVDRLTGQVVSAYPRETVIRLQSAPNYAQGSVIDTRA
jgi:flagellar protein FlaG